MTRNSGQVLLTFEFTLNTSTVERTFDAAEIIELLKTLRQLLGRNPTQAEVREVVIGLFNRIRVGAQVMDVIPWENYINVDLEA